MHTPFDFVAEKENMAWCKTLLKVHCYNGVVMQVAHYRPLVVKHEIFDKLDDGVHCVSNPAAIMLQLTESILSLQPTTNRCEAASTSNEEHR